MTSQRHSFLELSVSEKWSKKKDEKRQGVWWQTAVRKPLAKFGRHGTFQAVFWQFNLCLSVSLWPTTIDKLFSCIKRLTHKDRSTNIDKGFKREVWNCIAFILLCDEDDTLLSEQVWNLSRVAPVVFAVECVCVCRRAFWHDGFNELRERTARRWNQ